jgi:glycosyltransferase involved in cell wall biosynthesis
MFNPLVSIIIPVYNGSNYLHEAIDSALKQTYTNIEILVINDGSTDNGKTETIAQSYGNKIRYYIKKNGGVSTALNLGISEANGVYISWLSHDDVYMPNKIEEQIQFLKNYLEKNITPPILYSNCYDINEKSEIIGKEENININPSDFYEQLILRPFLNGCTTLIPKDAFTKVGYFKENLKTVQDYDMWFKLNNYYDFILINKYLLKSRIHSEMGTVKNEKIHLSEKDEFYIDVLKYLNLNEKCHISELAKIALSYKRRGLLKAYKHTLKLARENKKSIKSYYYIFLAHILNYQLKHTLIIFYKKITKRTIYLKKLINKS